MEQRTKQTISRGFVYVMLAALLIRLVIGGIYRGYDSDMTCFMGWADRLFSGGISSFYQGDGFNDYPPGYMYVLWVLGAIRHAFTLDYYSFVSVVLTKLPSMLCDLGTGYLIYRLAKERLGENQSLVCCALYVFSPAILLNSTIWGQVDSITAWLMLLVCYYVYNKKLPLAYFAFAIGFLVKPQMAFVFPVILMGIVDQVFLSGWDSKVFWKNLLSGLAAIAVMFLLALPFGLDEVIPQYLETVSSYPKATVNAYNLWAMLGLNWHDQTELVMGLPCQTWGTIFLVLLFAAAAIFWWRSKKDASKYFFISGFLVTGVFTLSVRMHERYMFYALALFLALYAIKPRVEFLLTYILLSVIGFINMYDVLFYYDAAQFDWEDPVSRTVGFFMLAAFIWICYLGVRYYCTEHMEQIRQEKISQAAGRLSDKLLEQAKSVQESPIRPSEKVAKLVKWDILIILAICLVYGAVALYDLGDRRVPENGWETHVQGSTIVLEFGENQPLSQLHYYQGNYHHQKYKIESAQSVAGPWNTVMEEADFASVFRWQEITWSEPLDAPFLRFTTLDNASHILEFVFLDAQGNPVVPKNASEYPELFDEQELYAERTTYKNSTYFDEIYHARTAYEYIHGLYSYENTHPPLGKIFISLGILLFGMNPFGWRIIGTLFGIAMLPFIYLFGKRMFKKSWAATVVTLLFAFDFMHFTQTRIATIDVFITFFVIAMYYFMYRYSQMSFYDTPLQKTFAPLALCGISMGLGVASKWTGVYAGLGLAVIFFAILYRRYKEYLYAKAHPGAKTGEISHDEIVRKFPVYTKKTILFCCVVFVVIPVCIYLLSYIPFSDNSTDGLITRMLNNQNTMFGYHSKLVSEHPYSSRWYEWPVMTRPVWYYSGHVSETVYEGISAFGNPLVWWTGIPAFFYMLYLALMKKERNARYLSIGYLAQYVPWFFVSRTTYMYHYFPSVPFVTLMLGYVFVKFAGEQKQKMFAVFAYAAAAIGLFILFYPVLSGHGVEYNFVARWLHWFPSWQLIGVNW